MRCAVTHFIKVVFAAAAFITITSTSHGAESDIFFSSRPNVREQADLDKSVENFVNLGQSINSLQALMALQQFEKGDCDDFIEYEGKAKGGDASSQYLLGVLYTNGWCVNKDWDQAIEFHQKAAAQSYTDSYYQLGLVYRSDDPKYRNEQISLEWLKKLGAANDARAYGLLSYAYARGMGTPVNYMEARTWAIRGAQEGDALAQHLAAVLLSTAPPVDFIEAYKWASLAAVSPNPEIVKQAGGLLKNLNGSMTSNQVMIAQNLASNFKIKSAQGNETSAELTEEKFPLPYVADNLADSLSPEQALNKLIALDIDKDRYVFFKSVEQDNVGLFKLFVRAGAPLETRRMVNCAGGTPLYVATDFGSKKIFDYLMSKNVNVNIIEECNGWTPLLRAIAHERYSWVDELLAKKADATQNKFSLPSNSMLSGSPLSYAIAANEPTLIEKILKAGGKLDEKYGNQATPAIIAAGECYPNSLEVLIKKNADLNQPDQFGISPLMHAVKAEKFTVQCIGLLINAASDVNYHTDHGDSALRLAVLLGNPEPVRILLEAGANPNERYHFEERQLPGNLDNETSRRVLMSGGTPLMLALSQRHASIVDLLLKHDANLYISADGMTAMDIVEKQGDKIFLDMLKKAKERSGFLSSLWQKIKSLILSVF